MKTAAFLDKKFKIFIFIFLIFALLFSKIFSTMIIDLAVIFRQYQIYLFLKNI